MGERMDVLVDVEDPAVDADVERPAAGRLFVIEAVPQNVALQATRALLGLILTLIFPSSRTFLTGISFSAHSCLLV